MSKDNKGKIYYSMQAISILPILMYGILIIFFSTYLFSSAMSKEVANGLEDSAALCISLFDVAYPGDYQLVESTTNGKTAYSLYKGEYDITKDYGTIDRIKETTGMDVTLFYHDTRILTTITNWQNQRIIGTGAPDIVVEEVLNANQAHFYDNVIISGNTYFAYYAPLTNSDGTAVGMLFIGKPAEAVNQMVNSSIYPIVIVGLLALAIAGIVSFVYAKNFLSSLHKLKHFFSKTSTGNLNTEMDKSILARGDELSEIAQAAVYMQSSLRKLVDYDTLTELYNRRSGTKKLQDIYTKSQKENLPFSLVIADIDHFKAINDTYGHQNGDIVLCNVANLLKKHTKERGYAVRWGGEEFLLIFENCDLNETLEYLKALQSDINRLPHQLDTQKIYVTMTMGVTCDSSMKIAQLIQEADKKLYEGKNNGRNCIIS